MSKSKFTPGPWELIEGKNAFWIGGHASDKAAQDAGFRSEICEILTHERDVMTPVDSANARLIAAAPDLLAALEQCRTYLSACRKETFPPGLSESVESAINKAKGGAE